MDAVEILFFFIIIKFVLELKLVLSQTDGFIFLSFFFLSFVSFIRMEMIVNASLYC